MTPGAVPRRVHIDWARGVAVLIMIQAHTLDAWTRPASRNTPLYGWLSVLGGFAAPLFLFLAGLSLVLAAERQLARGSTRSRAAALIVKRGAEIFILAFLFRLQAFVVSPGSWPVTIFRVDILNILGPSIALAGLIWWVSGGPRMAAVMGAAVALSVAMATPVVRVAGWVDMLPLWLEWYMRPFPEQTTFTLFPWSGFVFAGLALGVVTAAAATERADRWLMVWTAVAGSALVWFGFWAAARPSLYRESSFWTSSPTYFIIRVGGMLLFVALLSLLARWNHAWLRQAFDPLATFGRHSLFIYWIHVELVYGYVTWGIHRRLPLWGTAIGFLIFTVLMYGAIGLRHGLAERWKSRLAAGSAASPVAG